MAETSIVMFARDRYCPDVERSRNHLTELGLVWHEHDIEADEIARDTLRQKTGQTRVPSIIIGDAILIEPSDDELDQALDAAGIRAAQEEA